MPNRRAACIFDSMAELDSDYYRREAQLMRIKSDLEVDPELAAEFRRLAQAFEQMAQQVSGDKIQRSPG